MDKVLITKKDVKLLKQLRKFQQGKIGLSQKDWQSIQGLWNAIGLSITKEFSEENQDGKS